MLLPTPDTAKVAGQTLLSCYTTLRACDVVVRETFFLHNRLRTRGDLGHDLTDTAVVPLAEHCSSWPSNAPADLVLLRPFAFTASVPAFW